MRARESASWVGHPCQLGDGEAGHWHASAESGPVLGTQLVHHDSGFGGRCRVVPELGRPDDRVVLVEHDQAVLLPGDGEGHRVMAVRAELFDGRGQSLPPGLRVLFGDGRLGGGVGCRPRATTRPLSRSRASTLVDCVDESTPMTSAISGPVRHTSRPGSRAPPGDPRRGPGRRCSWLARVATRGFRHRPGAADRTLRPSRRNGRS